MCPGFIPAPPSPPPPQTKTTETKQKTMVEGRRLTVLLHCIFFLLSRKK
jgi:hypothetical protein